MIDIIILFSKLELFMILILRFDSKVVLEFDLNDNA